MKRPARIVMWMVAALVALAGCGQGVEKASIALLEAVRGGDSERALELVKKKASPNYRDPNTGESAFDVVMKRITERWSSGAGADPGDVQMVRAFVGAGGTLGDQQQYAVGAVLLGEDEFAELLIQASSPNIREATVYQALLRGRADLAGRLSKHYSGSGWSVYSSAVGELLDAAIARGDAQLAMAVLAVGVPAGSGRSLAAAAGARLTEVVAALLSGGADGGPALEQAAASGDLSALQGLLQAGIPATAGAPLAHAVYHGRWEVVDYLLSQGADLYAKSELPTLYGSALEAYVHEEYYGRFQPIAEALPLSLSSSQVLSAHGRTVSMRVSGRRLYAISDKADLAIYDIEAPSDSSFMASHLLPSSAYCLDVGQTASGATVAYVGTDGGIMAIDISDVESPALQGIWETQGSVSQLKLFQPARGGEGQGRLFAVAADPGQSAIYDFDLSGRLLGQTPITYGTVFALTEIGAELYAFVCSYGVGEAAVTCLSAAGEVVTGKDYGYLEAAVGDRGGSELAGGARFGDRVLAASGRVLSVYGVSRPAGASGETHSLVGEVGLGPYRIKAGSRMLLEESETGGKRIYLVTDGGVEVFDATEPPALPRLEGLFEVKSARDVAVGGDFLFVAADEGIHVVPVPSTGGRGRRPAEEVDAAVLAALQEGDAATVRRAMAQSYDPSGAFHAVSSSQIGSLVASGVISAAEIGGYDESKYQYEIAQMDERLESYRMGHRHSLPFELHEPLYLAIYYAAAGQSESMARAVRRLVLNGENPNYLDRESGRTPLAAAILIADVPEVVKALLEPSYPNGRPRADPNLPFYLDVPDPSRLAEMTPLAALVSLTPHNWAPTQTLSMAQSLLDAGADPFAPVVVWEGADEGEGSLRTEMPMMDQMVQSFAEGHELTQLIGRYVANYGAGGPGI